MFEWLKKLKKTRSVRCSDGTVIEVYRNPDDAVPIYVNAIQTEAHASAKFAETVSASAGGKYKEQVTGISKLVADETANMLMRFRIIYQHYSESPCARQDYFQRNIDELLRENTRFNLAKLQLETLVQLTKKGSSQAEVFAVFREVSLQIRQPVLVTRLKEGILEAGKIVDEWRQP